MAEMKHIQQCGRLGCSEKQQHWIYSQPRHLPVPEAAIRAFHITVNSPLLQSASRVSIPKFRLETNSTVVWLYAGGVSLISPDVRFGTVSLD